MKEKIRKSSKTESMKFIYKLVGLGLIILFFWILLAKGGPKLTNQIQPTITQSTTQLNGSKDGKSWGTASKSTNGINFELNVIGFLPTPGKGLGYYVFLKGNGTNLPDMLVGKMELQGDVYSLNYITGKDLYAYKSVVIVKETEAQSKEGKMTTVVLSGTFPK